jgi:tetratricopeptide (TPR) repeat protein
MSRIIDDVGLEDTAPSFYTRLDSTMKTSLALETIEKYDFTPTAIHTYSNKSIPDMAYHFDCPVDYENKQIMLRIMFESHFLDSIPVYVNVTRNELGIPTLTNHNITVFAGGVNSTVLFQNDLDKEITVRSTDPANYQRNQNDRFYRAETLSENHFAKITNEDKIRIPLGKAFSYHFSSFGNPNNTPLNYTISPSNVQGTITVIPYPDCASLDDIFTVYSTAHKVPQLPTYIPDGYEYECGSYHYPEPVILSFANQTLAEQFKGKIGHGKNTEFLAAGGLSISFYDLKPYGMYEFWPKSDKYTEIAERFSKDQMVTYLKGHPAVLAQRHYENPVNSITVYLDETRYEVEGRIPFSELYKIAEAIPFEKGGQSVPDTFENPFKDKSLVMELVDIQETHQPGPIHFEILTQGHIPISSHLDVTIQDSEGNVVWQNIPSSDIGDPEIGYVDYTWSTDYDLGVPQINNTGDYLLAASWNDVSIQHKFQVRDEVQYSLLRDMIPDHAHESDFLNAFNNDCTRREQITSSNAGQDIQQIHDKLQENNKMLALVFQKQEAITNDENRTYSYDVPQQVIHCIENIHNANDELGAILEENSQGPEYDISLLLRESKIFYHGREYMQAIETTDFILNLEENNVHALVTKGKALSGMGKIKEAIETYDKAISANPDYAEGWFRMGRALSGDHQHDKALQSYDKAIKIDSNYADAYIGKAFTLLTLERYDEAVENAKKAAQIYPDRPVYRDIYEIVQDASKYR